MRKIMKNYTLRAFNFFFIIFLFSQFSYSQLSAFTFNVTPTNETCLGNGALAFSVSGTLPGSTIDYSVYLLPNTSTPLVVVTTPTLTGLNAGNYLVIATQSSGTNSAQKTQNVTIVNQIQNLAFSINGIKVKCANDGVISVNVTSGNPVSYQILSGPVTTPLQSSNTFPNLPVGVYQIRVYDFCGEAVVQTFTLTQATISLVIDPVTFQNTNLPSCNSILVSHFFGVLSGADIAFPLTFQYTVYPPTGAPLTYSQVLTSGSTASYAIPFYHNQSYYYNLKVIDACGNSYTRNNNVVNKKFDFTASVLKLNCTEIALRLLPEFYVSPFTVSFLSFPVGFNPATFNSSHPGPFSGVQVVYGAIGNSFPTGSYTIQMTDACGRSSTKVITVTNTNSVPVAVGSNNGCGAISLLINSVQMVSVVMVNAPSTYTVPLPNNVSSLINPDGFQFFITGLPQGTYTFNVTDSCGIVHVVTATVAPYVPVQLSVIQRPGCSFGFGSVIVNDFNGISNAILIAAPSTYAATLPQDLSANSVNSIFYFGSVPEGNYTFQFTSNCGAQRTATLNVVGYQVTNNVVNVTENCGSFNLFLQYTSNGTFIETYWLQKFNPITGQWGHPATGIVYNAGSQLSGLNSVSLLNNSNNLNLAYSGQFRILKSFRYLEDAQYVSCIKIINNFDFSGGPKITNVYAFLCSSTTNEVIVEATGLPPLNYSITTKDGIPFVVNNGASNSFTNLEPAVYNFQVQDFCGNIVNSIFDITELEPFEIQSTVTCNGQNGSLSVPLFSFLTYEWYKGSNTSTILSTSNILDFTPYNSATDVGTYHVVISNPSNTTSCVDTTLNFTILPDPTPPNAGLDGTIAFCGTQGQLNLSNYLTGIFDNNGVWTEVTTSGGSLTNNLWNATSVNFGTYQFKYRVNGSCSSFDESFVEITINPIPQTPIASVDSVVCDGENLQLYATTLAGSTYQWTGPNGFTSTDQNPIIENATSINNGTYTVKTLANNCESPLASIAVEISALPKFSIAFECIDNQATLTAASLNNSFDENMASYQWSNVDGYLSSTNPTIITGEEKGIYTLTITNSLGCSTTNTFDVLNTLCKIPKGVSPNADGNNDTFDLSGFSNVEKVKIFNRYGMVVYELDNYVDQWNGQDKNGNLLPSATYYYLVNFANSEAKTGWVYLLREE
jgi:gliding motility-associated-like protein